MFIFFLPYISRESVFLWVFNVHVYMDRFFFLQLMSFILAQRGKLNPAEKDLYVCCSGLK